MLLTQQRTTREKSADFSVPRKKQSFFLWKCGVSNPALHDQDLKPRFIWKILKFLKYFLACLGTILSIALSTNQHATNSSRHAAINLSKVSAGLKLKSGIRSP